MKKKIKYVVFSILLLVLVVFLWNPLISETREEFCQMQGCGNGGGPLCAKKSFKEGNSTTTWYCYYGPIER